MSEDKRQCVDCKRWFTDLRFGGGCLECNTKLADKLRDWAKLCLKPKE